MCGYQQQVNTDSLLLFLLRRRYQALLNVSCGDFLSAVTQSFQTFIAFSIIMTVLEICRRLVAIDLVNDVLRIRMIATRRSRKAEAQASALLLQGTLQRLSFLACELLTSGSHRPSDDETDTDTARRVPIASTPLARPLFAEKQATLMSTGF